MEVLSVSIRMPAASLTALCLSICCTSVSAQPVTQPPSANTESNRLSQTSNNAFDGWREFHFGMSPEEAKKVATIPLDTNQPGGADDTQGDQFHHDIVYNSEVTIAGTLFEVTIHFVDLAHHTGTFTDAQNQQLSDQESQLPPSYKLNVIDLERDYRAPSTPCQLQGILDTLSSTYGVTPNLEPDVHNPGNTSFLFHITPTKLITVYEQEFCRDINIEYRDTSINQPVFVAPPPPSGQF